MTQEEKQLLFKDLCARLPYGVMCLISNRSASITEELKIGGLEAFEVGSLEVKPYLRPMSSMTYEEHRDYIQTGRSMSPDNPSALVDWLNAHHFDFRNLIGKGLAIDCTNLNIY